MIKWVLLMQLCLPQDFKEYCVRIIGNPTNYSFDECMFEGYEIRQDIYDVFKDGGDLKYSCVNTFTLDSLDKYR